MNMTLPDQVFIVAWIVIVGCIGAYFAKFSKSVEGYFLAGRNMTFPLIVASMTSSWHSLSYYLWLPGTVFLFGWSGWIVTCGAYVTMDLVSGYFFAYRARAIGVYSIPELYSIAYGERSHIVSGIAYFLFMGTFSAMEVIAIGLVLNFIFGIPIFIGIVVSTVLVSVYCWLGGQYAEFATDFLQFLMVALGTSIVAFWGLKLAAGTAGIENAISNVWTSSKLRPSGEWSVTQIIGFGVAALQGVFSPIHMARAASARNAKTARDGILCSLYSMLSHDWLLIVIGISSAVLLSQAPENPDQTILLLSAKILPPLVLGIFVASLLSNGLDTINSTLIAGATILGRDFYQERIRPEATQTSVINVGRIAVLLYALLSIGIGYFADSLLQVVYYSGQVFAPAFVVPVFAIFFYKKPKSDAAAVASMLTGILGSILWLILKEPAILGIPIPGSVFGICTSLIGFILGNQIGTKKEDVWRHLLRKEST